MATTPNSPEPHVAPTPTVPDRTEWVLPVIVIGAVVVLMACAFGAFLIHAYPALKEPLTMALSIATLAGLLVATVVLLHRKR
ncbi:hypothetical protein ACFU67_06055 [Streptomyces rhizosphaericola]|uniref:hypothetical protein n=1 Tax=Streptomyces rhizosphaericola TaxID=2564098 RepID=UPI0036876C47